MILVAFLTSSLTLSSLLGLLVNGQATTESHDQNSKDAIQQLSSKFEKMEERFARGLYEQHQNMKEMQSICQTIASRLEKYDQILNQVNNTYLKAIENHNQNLELVYQNLSIENARNKEKLEFVFRQVKDNYRFAISKGQCEGSSSVCDCSDVRSMGYTENGVYLLYVVHERKRLYKNAFCDFKNGNWTVFQRRKDGSEDFYRGWNDYKDGFGNRNGEFWLGNEFIHLLTSKKSYRLRIDMEDFEGVKTYAEYSKFNISSSADKFRLSVGTFSGNTRDSLSSVHNGRQFSTKDAENDPDTSRHCAVSFQGAWWYGKCHESNLNGIYKHGNYPESDCYYCGVEWQHWRNFPYSLKTTEMKISPVA